MKIILTDHTRKRMRERSLKTEDIRMALLYPDRLEVDRTDDRRLLAKRVYQNNKTGTRHLLMIVCEVNDSVVEVVTVISTSKISKYL